QSGPVGIGRFGLTIHEVGQLDDEEREILAKIIAPLLNHGRELMAIGLGGTGVGFSLVPGYAGDSVGEKGRDHAVVETVWRHAGAARRLWRGLAFRLCFLHLHLVLFE